MIPRDVDGDRHVSSSVCNARMRRTARSFYLPREESTELLIQVCEDCTASKVVRLTNDKGGSILFTIEVFIRRVGFGVRLSFKCQYTFVRL